METKVDLPKIWVNSLVNVIQRRHEGVLTCQLFSRNPQGLILLLRGPAQRSFSLQPNSRFKLTPVWMTDVPEREYSQLLLLSEALPLRWLWASPTQSFKITGWLVLERRLKRHSKASRRQNKKQSCWQLKAIAKTIRCCSLWGGSMVPWTLQKGREEDAFWPDPRPRHLQPSICVAT